MERARLDRVDVDLDLVLGLLLVDRLRAAHLELLHELAQQVPVNGSGALQYEAFFDALHVVDCDRLSQVV